MSEGSRGGEGGQVQAGVGRADEGVDSPVRGQGAHRDVGDDVPAPRVSAEKLGNVVHPPPDRNPRLPPPRPPRARPRAAPARPPGAPTPPP